MKTEEQFQAWLVRQGKEKDHAYPSQYYGDPAKHVKFANERGRMTGQELHALCEQWREWCRTRHFFIAPGAKNILARMQPHKVGQPPDACLSDDISWFNMAIHALADMDGEDPDCFVKYYWFRLKNIKKVAGDMGIGRQTFYDRRNRFAERAYSMGLSLKRAHAQMMAAPKDAVEID